MDDIVNGAMSVAIGIVMVIFIIVLFAWLFHDWVFDMLWDIRDAWQDFRDGSRKNRE